MLQLPLWKRTLVLLLCAAAMVLAAPNLFYDRVERHNDALARIEAGTDTPELQADRALWPDWLPSNLVNLGLDLRGGAHLLAEVHVSDVYADRIDALWPEVRDLLRAEREIVGGVRRMASDDPGVLRVAVANAEGLQHALTTVQTLSRPIQTLTGIGQQDLDIRILNGEIAISLSEAERLATDDRTMRQSLEIIRRRVDEVGTREPTIVREGSDRIVIQVPGIGSAQELKDLIGTTARLTFHPVVRTTTNANETPEPRQVIHPSMDDPTLFYVLEQTPVVSGEQLTDAQPDFDQNGRPAVSFRFNPVGARDFGLYTAENIGNPFAIVLDGEVISAPVIQAHISGGSGIITGRFTVEESTQLAVLLRAGALPAGMTFLEERTIGPELGQDSIDAGRVSAIVAFALVMGYMVLSYGVVFGMASNIALMINVVSLLALLSVIGGTLTLPGIAGIVLTMGMAVDANVLIYERVREELRAGRNPARALEQGFDKALSAIMDANITTLIASLIMFALGSGPIRGFAVTLGIGIFTTIFSAIYVNRVLLGFWLNARRPKTLDL